MSTFRAQISALSKDPLQNKAISALNLAIILFDFPKLKKNCIRNKHKRAFVAKR